MKRNLLAWLLLMILSSLAITNSSFGLEPHRGTTDVNVSRLQGQQETIHGGHTVGSVRLNGSEEDYGRASNKEQGDLVVSEKGQKGANGGGANVANRPRQDKNSATPCSYLIGKTRLHISFSLVLLLSFNVL